MGLHTRDAEGRAFLARYFGALEGAKIENVRLEDDEFEDWNGPWPTFDVVLHDGTRYDGCQISQDEEGNGPGFIFGLPTPAPTPEQKGYRN